MAGLAATLPRREAGRTKLDPGHASGNAHTPVHGRRPTLVFAGFELDPEGPELRRDGVPVELHPTPLRLLAYLAGSHGRIVPARELLAEVWADSVVSETALASALKEVRRALGDDGGRIGRALGGQIG